MVRKINEKADITKYIMMEYQNTKDKEYVL